MKTKVIAFRVTQDEYDALAFNCGKLKMKLGEYVYKCLLDDIDTGALLLMQEKKRLEAKAKRDAKKAANAAQ
jgi:hypothetical protein